MCLIYFSPRNICRGKMFSVERPDWNICKVSQSYSDRFLLFGKCFFFFLFTKSIFGHSQNKTCSERRLLLFYTQACIQRTCNCGGSLQQCLCVSLGSYVKACTGMGVTVGDWRKDSNCSKIFETQWLASIKFEVFIDIYRDRSARSSAVSEEPKILLCCASLQPHMPLSVWTWPPLRTERRSCGGLRLSAGNPPQPRSVHSKVGVSVPLQQWNHSTGVCGNRRTPVVSWSSHNLCWFQKSFHFICHPEINNVQYCVCGGNFRSTFSVSAAASVRMESWNAQRIVVNWYSSYRTVFIFIIADVSWIFILNCRHLHLVTSLKCKSLWASCV